MTNIKDTFKQFDDLEVLILGDVMLDRYLHGRVDRVSPEAPVPIVRLEDMEARLGGAANVALNIKAMGACPILCSIIGKDSAGQQLQGLLPENDISADYLIHSKARPTTVKTRVIASAQHLLRIDEESTDYLSDEEAQEYLQLIEEILQHRKIKVILFQDYNKGVLSKAIIHKVIQLAQERNIPTAVDPKFTHFFEYQHCTLFKPNLKEIREALALELPTHRSALDQADKKLRSKLNHQYSLITLSEKGIYWNDGAHAEIQATHPRSIVDVCGAGDSVISVATLGLAIGLDLAQISYLSNLAGGQTCESVGVVPVNRQQLEAEYLRLKKV